MIFVTVGTHTQGFDRLVKAMDELAENVEEKVVIQWGSSKYIPNHADQFKWVTGRQIEQFIQESRVVVGHAGSGTIISCLLMKKPLVLVPRRKMYNEHNDDHQLQLARVLEANGRAVVVNELSVLSLQTAIDNITTINYESYGAKKLVDAIQQQINQWSNPKTIR